MSDVSKGSGIGGSSWYQSGYTRTVSALFENRHDAERAMAKLKADGIAEQNIRMIEGRDDTTMRSSTEDSSESGSFWESLSDFFFPDDDRNTYAEGLHRGGFLITVQTDPEHHAHVVDILNTDGVVDLDERQESWQAEGWSSDASSQRDTDEETVIPLPQQELSIGRRQISAGAVRVRSYVVETPVNETVRLRREKVDVSRRPATGKDESTEDAFLERTVEAHETEEVPVVNKQTRVNEEVVVKKQADTREENVSDTLRKTEVEVNDDRKKKGAGTDKGIG
jgi:uncharacterized protein (TIGR02271 family)